MKYRINRKTGDRISEISIGTSYLFEADWDEAVEAVRMAIEGGINFFDLAAGGRSSFPIFREAAGDVRKDIFYQMHFGAIYNSGSYEWSLELDQVKRSVDKMLSEIGTDYMDYGFIHCLDETADWETFQNNGVYRYIQELKEQGVVKHIGLSSHTPSVVQKVMDDVEIDILMFSVNPAYDYGHGEYGKGGVDERSAVYLRCEREGVGISVMKPFAGGLLLDAAQSPFGKALSRYQCIHYALDKPGVVTVIPGVRGVKEVADLLAYYDQPEEALDHSVIGSFAPPDAIGKCVYCNHCSPCPAGIDVGLVNKYYDVARAGDQMAAEHYRTLARSAADCIQCGHCDSRCPFSVAQGARMQEIDAYMKTIL